MARKFGKKKEISLNPLDYNICLIGESGCGKSTLAKEVCEKLVGDDGYIALNIGKEDGHDAINGIVTADIPDWETFEEFCDDVIDNKETDYKNLQVIIVDTFDQLMDIAEKEVIRRNNSKFKDKKVESIKAAFGGYMAGQDMALDIVLNKLWEIKEIGVNFFAIGHTKMKETVDPISGETYTQLTSNLTQRYFTGLKDKLHFCGVAYIDRDIVNEDYGKENIKTHKKDKRGKITSECRKITFRDDNYSIDSKSRFADIVNEIPLDPDEFIKALSDAIMAEYNKGETGDDIEKVKKKQAKAKKEKAAEKLIDQKAKKAVVDEDKERKELVTYIAENYKGMTTEGKMKVKTMLTSTGASKFSDKSIDIGDLCDMVDCMKAEIAE